MTACPAATGTAARSRTIRPASPSPGTGDHVRPGVHRGEQHGTGDLVRALTTGVGPLTAGVGHPATLGGALRRVERRSGRRPRHREPHPVPVGREDGERRRGDAAVPGRRRQPLRLRPRAGRRRCSGDTVRALGDEGGRPRPDRRHRVHDRAGGSVRLPRPERRRGRAGRPQRRAGGDGAEGPRHEDPGEDGADLSRTTCPGRPLTAITAPAARPAAPPRRGARSRRRAARAGPAAPARPAAPSGGARRSRPWPRRARRPAGSRPHRGSRACT